MMIFFAKWRVDFLRRKTRTMSLLLLAFFCGEFSMYATPLSLDSCLSLALINSVQIENAELEVEMAKQTRNAARTKYFPSVSASAMSYSALNPYVKLGVDDIPNAAIRDLLHNLYYENPLLLQGVEKNIEMLQKGTMVSVMAVQPIYAGGRIITGNSLAKIGVEATKYQTNLARKNVLLTTEESYWQILSLQEKARVVSKVQMLLDTLYRDVNGAYEAGLTTQNNVLQVKLKQNELSSSLITLKNGIRLSKMALCQSIGIAYSDTLTLADTLQLTVSPLEYYKPTEIAVTTRAEVKLLDISVKVEKLQHKMILGEALPQMAVGAGYTYNDLLFDKNSFNGLLFATVQIPITAWWETGHNLKKQRLKQQIAENNRRDITEKLILQTQQIWDELEAAYLQVKLSEEAVKYAEKNSTLVQTNYKAGLVSLAELMQAQTLLTQAFDQQSDQQITYRIKLTHYRQLVE